MNEPAETSTRPSLRPIRVGSIDLRNRIVQSATVTNLGRNLAVTDELIAFYVERAKGGVAAIVTEGLSVHPTSIPNGTVPLAYDERLIEGFARMASAVHSHGAALFGQLWHVGRQGLWNPSLVPWAPSGGRDPYSGSTPHVMTDAEILEVVAGFAKAARNLASAGFDGVELHGAHGYLITQFLSPLSNRRDDRWGGSLANRSRFVVEVIRAIRAVVPNSFVVGLKLSVHEYVPGGLDLEGACATTELLANGDAPDYIATGQGNFSPSLEKHVPDLHFDDAQFAFLTSAVRKSAAGIPVMAVSKIPDLVVADRLLTEQTADLIGMTRALLADAHLVAKSAAGLSPRPCIYCNVCWDYIHTGRVVSCIYAPETGREGDVPVATRKKHPLQINVVGAGPAGLEFSRVALEYGHQVRLHEQSGAVGGRLRTESQVPGREVYLAATGWLEGEVRRLGGDISTDDALDGGEVSGLRGDLTVIATGAIPVPPPLPGTNGVISLEDVIHGLAVISEPVVIIDEIEGEPVYAVAEDLARRGFAVTLVTRRPAIGRRVAYISMIGVQRRFDLAGIKVHTLMIPLRVEDGQLIATHSFSGQEHNLGPVGTIVAAGPYRASVTEQVDGKLVIGDASAPREVLALVREANAAAHRAFGGGDSVGNAEETPRPTSVGELSGL